MHTRPEVGEVHITTIISRVANGVGKWVAIRLVDIDCSGGAVRDRQSADA